MSQRAAVAAIAVLMFTLPVSAEDNPNCRENYHSQALLIGNKAYKQTFDVPYAHNDVAAIKTFLIEKLCYRESNIEVLPDATFNEMRDWLGSKDTPRGQLWNQARKGRSNIFVYYSGHGVPDQTTKQAYLLPVDTNPNKAQFGFSFNTLDSNLNALNRWIGPKRTVTLIIDACFSGRSAGGALLAHKGSFTPVIPSGRDIIRFSAARADQLAYWNNATKLSLFTEVFIEAVSGKADQEGAGNRDGKISGSELTHYLSDQISYRARKLHGKIQTPMLPDGDYIGWEIKSSAPAGITDKKSGPALIDRELAFWQAVKDSKDPAEFEAFLRQFPKGAFAELASIRLKRLKRTKVAVGTFLDKPAATTRTYRPGDTFKDCDACPSMIVVPAGSFMMGSPGNENGREHDEGPQRQVTIARAFAVGKFEVTRAQFEVFVQETGHQTGNKCWTYEGKYLEERLGRYFRNPGYAQDGQHPVVCVNWNEAQAYVKWLGTKTGKTYRLLSEAEWEYVARAGAATRFSFGNGDSDLCRHANAADRSTPFDYRNKACSDGVGERTAQAGRYLANPFGLHDLHGNAYEWVADCWFDNYKGAPTDGSARTGGDCSQRVLRGGSWKSEPRALRSANRYRASTDDRDSLNGFRVARTLDP